MATRRRTRKMDTAEVEAEVEEQTQVELDAAPSRPSRRARHTGAVPAPQPQLESEEESTAQNEAAPAEAPATTEEEEEGEEGEEDDEFDLSSLVSSAASSLASKLLSSASVAVRPARPQHTRVIHSSTDLDRLFSRSVAPEGMDKSTASVAATIPAGFVRKGGVLQLSAKEEARAAAQKLEPTQAGAADAQDPDLLAAIGGKTQLALHNPTQQRKREQADSKAPPSAGKNWFNFSRPSVITKEMKTDLQLLSLRAYMDPKKFYKKSGKKKKGVVPAFFQMGTVIEGAHEFYSSRLSNAQRTEHYADEFTDARRNRGATKKLKHYLKRKQIEVQTANTPAKRTFNKKRKMMDDAQKRPGMSKKKKGKQ